MCTKNYDQKIYGCWDMVPDGRNYLPFWVIFCPFTPITPLKIKIKKKKKKKRKALEIPSFYISVLKIIIRRYMVRRNRCNSYFSFWAIFCLFTNSPPNDPKNQNFKKMKKLLGNIIILHICTKNYDQMIYGSWDMVGDGCNYFSFWAIFCPFASLTAPKIKILKNFSSIMNIS